MNVGHANRPAARRAAVVHEACRASEPLGRASAGADRIEVAPGAMLRVPVFLIQPDPRASTGRTDFRIRVRDERGDAWEISHPFLSRPHGESHGGSRSEHGDHDDD